MQQSVRSRVLRSIRRPGIRVLGPIGIALLVAAVLVAAVQAPRLSSASVDLSDGSAWLPNQNAGGAFLVNGITADIVWTLPVAEPGADLTVVQQPRGALVLDRTAGVLSRIDNVALEVSARSPLPDVKAVSLATNDAVVYVLDSGAGRVRQLDAKTLVPLGEIPISGDLRGVVDDDDRLWALDRSSGRVHLVEDGQVSRTVDVFPGGDDTDIVLAGNRPTVVDATRAEVAVLQPSGGSVDRLTLSTSGELLAADERGGGATASIMAPEAGALVTCGTSTGGCRARSLEPVARAGQQFGRPEAHRGVVYIPNLSTGEVVVVDAADSDAQVRVVPVLAALSPGLEVFAKDDLVWFNNAQGNEAGVLNRDGLARRVEKYASGMSDADVRALVLRSRGAGVAEGNGDGAGADGPEGGDGTGDAAGSGDGEGAGAGNDAQVLGARVSAGTAEPGPAVEQPGTRSGPDQPSRPTSTETESEPLAPITLAGEDVDADPAPSVPTGARSSSRAADTEPDRPPVISRPSGGGSGGSGPGSGPGSSSDTAAPGAFAVEIQTEAAAAKRGAPFQLRGAALAGKVASWSWDFGDGTTDDDQSVSKTWASAGTFRITLRARSEGGAETQASQLIRVVAPDDLLASFSVSRSSVDVGEVVRFGDTSVGEVDRWRWEFGDGTRAEGRAVEHAWTNAGTYPVTLVAANATKESRAETTIVVNATQQPPVAAFEIQGELAVNQPVTFIDRSSNDPTSWSWTFGDGGTASGSTVSHQFTTAGEFTVTLVAANASGRGAPAQRLVKIIDKPRPPSAVNVAVTGSTDTTLDVTWSYDNPTGATFETSVRWATADGPQRVELDPTARGTRLGGLQPSTTYPVEVVVALPGGGGSTSGSASGTTQAPSPPPPPPPPPPTQRPPTNVTLQVTGTTSSTVSLSWTYDNPDNATYVASINWGTGGSLATRVDVDPAAGAYRVTGLAPETAYEARLTVGLPNNGAYTMSPVVAAKTTTPPTLATPVITSAIGGTDSIQVEWKFDDNGVAARLLVLWAGQDGSAKQVELPPSATTYTITGLPAATTYDVQVIAQAADGTTTASGKETVATTTPTTTTTTTPTTTTTTTTPAPTLATPVITSATGGAGSAEVAWTFDDNGAATRLLVTWTAPDGSVQQAPLAPSATGYTIGELAAATTYEVRVAAEAADGTVRTSAPRSVTTT